jgi:hypothetical protein
MDDYEMIMSFIRKICNYEENGLLTISMKLLFHYPSVPLTP